MWNRSRPTLRAESAGTHPDGRVHPGAIRAARQRGLDLSKLTPRLLDPSSGHHALIATVCDQAREELAGSVSVHWSVPDPVVIGTDAAFRAAADEIEWRVERLTNAVTQRSRTQRTRGRE